MRVAALLALALVSCAAVPQTGFGTTTDGDIPPIRFQGNNHARVLFTDLQTVHHICDKEPNPPGWYTFGCFTLAGTLVIENPCPAANKGDDYAQEVCHELGHINGWPGNHPR